MSSSTIPESSSIRSPDAWRAPEAESHVNPAEIAVGVVIGRTSEYFDFFVYGLASVMVFPTVFFPKHGLIEGTLAAFAVFALAFVARPFGTILFMHVQQRWGRGAKLTAALFLLGTATAGMAFLPGYAVLGNSSVLLLIALRIMQGIAFGGSWDGLPSLLAIHAPPSRRGWYAMLGQLGAPIGFILAGVLFLYLKSSLPLVDFIDWGWRYPFYVAFAINVVALFARLRLIAGDEFAVLMEKSQLVPIGIIEMLRSQGANVLVGAFASLATYALFHLVTVFPLSWTTLGMVQDDTTVLGVQITGAGLCIIGLIASGLIADRIGRRRLLALVACLIGVFSVAVPWLLSGGAAAQNAFILIGFILLGLSYGQASGVVASKFSPHYRYTGAALTSDLAWLIGAAFAPFVALSLSVSFGPIAVGLYILSGVVSTLLALLLSRSVGARD